MSLNNLRWSALLPAMMSAAQPRRWWLFLTPSDERVELLAAVARGHHDGLSPRLADGVEELVYEYVE